MYIHDGFANIVWENKWCTVLQIADKKVLYTLSCAYFCYDNWIEDISVVQCIVFFDCFEGFEVMNDSTSFWTELFTKYFIDPSKLPDDQRDDMLFYIRKTHNQKNKSFTFRVSLRFSFLMVDLFVVKMLRFITSMFLSQHFNNLNFLLVL